MTFMKGGEYGGNGQNHISQANATVSFFKFFIYILFKMFLKIINFFFLQNGEELYLVPGEETKNSEDEVTEIL